MEGQFEQRIEQLTQQLTDTRREATIDPLTGAANRRLFEAMMSSGERDIIVAMFDVDNFKRINDTLGHAVGDAVLIAVADAIKTVVRSDDVMSRFGGDEFAVLMGAITLRQAELCLRSIMNTVATTTVGPDNETPATISCSGSELSAGDTRDALLARADNALYDAKRAGKSRMIMREAPLHQGTGRSCRAPVTPCGWRPLRTAAGRRPKQKRFAGTCDTEPSGAGMRLSGDGLTSMSDTTMRETLGFQAEVTELLHLMIHSLYGNKEIFLRELVSNASDAADKLRFEALADAALFENDPELKIRVSYDTQARTITVSDNGIGMSRQEVVEQIGTIAKSGTREFLQSLTSDHAKDAHLIGQFGVGFYASFIVADRVTLLTRRAGLTAEHGVLWESAGKGDYTIETMPKDVRGTEIVLHLRPEEDELLSGTRLREILRKYSDHITVPIVMRKEQWDSEAKAQISTDEDEQINQASALWARSKSEITEEQYEEFYKHVAHDFEAPLAYSHAKVEGRQEYTQLLFIPQRAPFDLWDRDHRRGIKLYVQRVFIMDDAEHLMPTYLRFVRGIIDSSDLPLNISREILQQSRDVQTIRTASVKRVLGLLEDLAANHGDKFATFWTEFGRVFKEGVAEDSANRDRIAGLLRFASTRDDGGAQTVSLSIYVGRMKEGQKTIYFITADGLSAARNSPHLEIFRKLGVEVLLMHDRIDEWVASSLTEFEGTPLQSVAKGGLDLGALGGEPAKPVEEAETGEHGALIERIQGVLKDRASAVRVTDRLTDSPACLVSEEGGMSTNLERMLKAAGQDVPVSRPVLEVNLQHPIVQRLRDESDEARFADWSQILFDQATLAEGGRLEDPAAFVKRLNDLMLTLAGTASKIWMPGA